MERIIKIAAFIILFSNNLIYAQAGQNIKNETMIDYYFKPYSSQPKFKVTTMGEAMVKRSNEFGMWTHPSIARIMKQVKMYQYLNFDSSPAYTLKVLDNLDASVKKDKIYEEYFRWELNGITSSIIYTKGNSNIKEIVYITISSKQMHVSCYVGDNISVESIRALAKNQ